MAAFIAVAAIGSIMLDRFANRATITVVVEAKHKIPGVIGDLPALMIKVSGISRPKDGWLTASSGWFGATREADFALFNSIREGCHYRMVIHNRNARGAGHYEIISAEPMNCPCVGAGDDKSKPTGVGRQPAWAEPVAQSRQIDNSKAICQ